MMTAVLQKDEMGAISIRGNRPSWLLAAQRPMNSYPIGVSGKVKLRQAEPLKNHMQQL
jgi:hypothetical protein